MGEHRDSVHEQPCWSPVLEAYQPSWAGPLNLGTDRKARQRHPERENDKSAEIGR